MDVFCLQSLYLTYFIVNLQKSTIGFIRFDLISFIVLARPHYPKIIIIKLGEDHIWRLDQSEPVGGTTPLACVLPGCIGSIWFHVMSMTQNDPSSFLYHKIYHQSKVRALDSQPNGMDPPHTTGEHPLPQPSNPPSPLWLEARGITTVGLNNKQAWCEQIYTYTSIINISFFHHCPVLWLHQMVFLIVVGCS